MDHHSCLLLTLVLVSLSCVKAQFNFACEQNFCSTKVGPCPPLECEGGRIIQNATQCGCCDVCVKSLDLGDECRSLEHATIPRVECGPGLMCMNGKCAHANTKCVQEQVKYDSEDVFSDFMTAAPRSECDDFGDFKPVRCRPGMLCFCVDRNGFRIFGTSPYSEHETVQCNCSRDFVEFRGIMKRSDQFLRCAENGNYDALQCSTKNCFCMDDQGKLDGRAIDVNASITTLKCYNPKRHKGQDMILRTKCWRERDKVEEQIQKYRGQGIMVIGVDLPHCDLDGSYKPVQCTGDSCYCVKKDGSPYEQRYSVKRNSKLQRKMNCRCAREKELIRNQLMESLAAQTFSQYKCLPNGNYQPMQCLASTCFCIDSMGFQITETVLMHDRFFLKCYRKEYENQIE